MKKSLKSGGSGHADCLPGCGVLMTRTGDVSSVAPSVDRMTTPLRSATPTVTSHAEHSHAQKHQAAGRGDPGRLNHVDSHCPLAFRKWSRGKEITIRHTCYAWSEIEVHPVNRKCPGRGEVIPRDAGRSQRKNLRKYDGAVEGSFSEIERDVNEGVERSVGGSRRGLRAECDCHRARARRAAASALQIYKIKVEWSGAKTVRVKGDRTPKLQSNHFHR